MGRRKSVAKPAPTRKGSDGGQHTSHKAQASRRSSHDSQADDRQRSASKLSRQRSTRNLGGPPPSTDAPPSWEPKRAGASRRGSGSEGSGLVAPLTSRPSFRGPPPPADAAGGHLHAAVPSTGVPPLPRTGSVMQPHPQQGPGAVRGGAAADMSSGAMSPGRQRQSFRHVPPVDSSGVLGQPPAGHAPVSPAARGGSASAPPPLNPQQYQQPQGQPPVAGSSGRHGSSSGTFSMLSPQGNLAYGVVTNQNPYTRLSNGGNAVPHHLQPLPPASAASPSNQPPQHVNRLPPHLQQQMQPYPGMMMMPGSAGAMPYPVNGGYPMPMGGVNGNMGPPHGYNASSPGRRQSFMGGPASPQMAPYMYNMQGMPMQQPYQPPYGANMQSRRGSVGQGLTPTTGANQLRSVPNQELRMGAPPVQNGSSPSLAHTNSTLRPSPVPQQQPHPIPQEEKTPPVVGVQPAAPAATAAPLVRTTSILNRQSSFKKQSAAASAFPADAAGATPAPTSGPTVVPLVRTTSILNRQSSFKKQSAPASAFPAQQQQQQQQSQQPQQPQQPQPQQAPPPQQPGYPTSQQQRQSPLVSHPSMHQGNGSAPQFLAGSPHSQRMPFPQQQPVGLPGNGVPPAPSQYVPPQPYPPQMSSASPVYKAHSPQQLPLPSQPATSPAPGAAVIPPPVMPAPALVRTESILNRQSSFKKSKIESAEDTRKRHEAELAKKHEAREREIAKAREEQMARDAELRRMKEERLRLVMERQRLRAEAGSTSPIPDASTTLQEGKAEAKHDPLPRDEKTRSAATTAVERVEDTKAKDSHPLAVPPAPAIHAEEEVVHVMPSTVQETPQRAGSADSYTSDRGRFGASTTSAEADNTSLLCFDDGESQQDDVNVAENDTHGTPTKEEIDYMEQLPATPHVAAHHGPAPRKRAESPVAMVEAPTPRSSGSASTRSQGEQAMPPSSSTLTPPPPPAVADAQQAGAQEPSGDGPRPNRAPTLVLYEIPLRRRKNSERDAEQNPVKTYGEACNDIRVAVPDGPADQTANFTVDELFAHRKSSTYMESKLLKKITATVASGRSASVFSVDSAKLTPDLVSSPMESPSWFAHQWLVNDLAEKLTAAKKAQLEEDYTELAISFALIHHPPGSSAAVVEDLLSEKTIPSRTPLTFYETPLLGKCVSGVVYKLLKEEGDFVSLFARAQSNASNILYHLQESTKNPEEIKKSLVFVVTCAFTQRKPGRLPDLGETDTWCRADAKMGLDGGFTEDSDTEDVEAADFLTRQPQNTHPLRPGEGDVVRSCLTMVAVDDRFPLLLSPAEAASGKLPTSSPLDPRLRSWIKSLLVGPTFSAVMASIDPADPDAARVLEVQRTVAAAGRSAPRYSSCRRALARELAADPFSSSTGKAEGQGPLDVTAFVKEVEACRLLSGHRFLQEE